MVNHKDRGPVWSPGVTIKREIYIYRPHFTALGVWMYIPLHCTPSLAYKTTCNNTANKEKPSRPTVYPPS